MTHSRPDGRFLAALPVGAETLSAFRWTATAYLLVLAARAGDRVRVEPFDAIELDVAEIFGHEAPEP